MPLRVDVPLAVELSGTVIVSLPVASSNDATVPALEAGAEVDPVVGDEGDRSPIRRI